MLSKSRNILLAAIVGMFSFLMVTYVSCKKPAAIVNCNNYICQNGGYCSMDTATDLPKCNCPVGFEGSDCSIASATKFFGTWSCYQVIVGCDSPAVRGQDSTYPVQLKETATPTTFFLANFFNNAFYDNIVCQMDSVDNYVFAVDTASPWHAVNDNFKLLWGWGRMNPAKDTINGILSIRYKNRSTNWQIDTITIQLSNPAKI